MTMTSYREALEFNTELSDPQKLDLAADLESMMQTPGWDAFLVLLKNMRQEILESGIHDNDKPRDFYRGKIVAVDEMAELLKIHVVNGYAIREAQERKPKSRSVPAAVPSAFKPGGGGF